MSSDCLFFVKFISRLLAAIICCLHSPSVAVDRHYYIGIVEIEWDYSTGQERLVPFWPKTQNDDWNTTTAEMMPQINGTLEDYLPHRTSGDHSYVKAVFRLFSDEKFWQQLEHPPEMGLVGPLIAASPGDNIFIHCKNFARLNFNIHPHLVHRKSDDDGKVEAEGGLYVYKWSVKDDGDSLEPCTLGAYHSAFTSMAAEIEAGLFGPLLICKRNVLPELIWNDYRLKTGELLTFAVAKIFNEHESIYHALNNVDTRERTSYPTINGLTQNGALNRSISLFNRMECNVKEMPGIYLHSFAFGGNSDSNTLLTTSCGLMMKNGRTMAETLPSYSGSFSSLYFSMSELARFANKDDCFLQNAEPTLSEEGMSLPIFPSTLPGCPIVAVSVPNSEIPLYKLFVEAILWDYHEKDCSRYWKLRFSNNTNGTGRHDEAAGLVGPVMWTSISQQFQVLLTVPKLVLDEMVNSSSPPQNEYSIGIKMPEIIEELFRSDESDSTSFVFRYTFTTKSSRIGTNYDPPCRPFVYSATFTKNGVNSNPLKTPSFDTGLFGALIVCQNENFLEKAKLDDFFILTPIVIDESMSWLAPLNGDCLGTIPSPIYRTINGHSNGLADFGLLKRNSVIYWYLLAIPPLPGRHALFQHTITFSDEGRRNPIYVEQMDDPGDRILLPGSTVILQGCGRVVVMDVGGGTSWFTFSPIVNNSIERWSIYCQITGHFSGGMQASFSVFSPAENNVPSEATDVKVVEHYFIMAQEFDWDYNGNASSLHVQYQDDSVLSSRRHTFQKMLYRNVFKENRVLSDNHLSLLGPVVVLTPAHPVHITFVNMARRPVGINPGAGVISTPLDAGAELLMDGSVEPGKAVTFVWRLPDIFKIAPPVSDRFSECSATLYTSGHNKVGDLYAGLIGPLLICPVEKRRHGVRRFFTLFARFDESRSSLASENRLTKEEIDSLSQPLVFETINGRLFGAIDQPGFSIYANQSVDWFMFSIGDTDDIHTVHFHGSTLNYVDADGTPRTATDTVTLFPGQSITGLSVAGRMQHIPPGVWPFHCHVFEHGHRGMVAQYIVSDQIDPASPWSSSLRTFPCLLFVITMPLVIIYFNT